MTDMSLPKQESKPSPAESAARRSRSTVAPPRISPWLFAWFSWYTYGYTRKHFNSVRVTRHSHTPDQYPNTPLLIYLNHPGWWDPMICMVSGTTWLKKHFHYAPIDAKAVEKYAFLKKIGFVPISHDDPKTIKPFMKTAQGILARDKHVLWITAQGKFVDSRERPVELMPGLQRIIHRSSENLTVLPMAIEYVYWQEKLPEALVHVGPPVEHQGKSREETGALLGPALEEAMDHLRELSIARREEAFDTILEGRHGVGFVYDNWRRFKSFLKGERFDTRHADAMKQESA